MLSGFGNLYLYIYKKSLLSTKEVIMIVIIFFLHVSLKREAKQRRSSDIAFVNSCLKEEK